ncbi:MAG: ATP-binding protein [Bacteroidales bacterium]|nr:ATP-binding protein [Bacteroidales bacterium]
MKNPFKFGSIVESPYFTDREEDLAKVLNVVNSANHLVLISPRRYGKTSLINKAMKQIERPVISLNLQLVTDISDLSSELVKRVFKVYPMEKVKQQIKQFRIVPTLTLNPIINTIDISFMPGASPKILLEDVFDMIERLDSKGKRPVVVLDEFQEIRNIDKNLDKILRSIIQLHKNVNYVFMGSLESLMKDIFERKKSSFYHFGVVQTLDKIPAVFFKTFLDEGFNGLNCKNKHLISDKILNFTQCHPYYTQQLAFHYWNSLKDICETTLDEVVEKLIQQHDVDYERLWMTLNLMDRKLLIELSQREILGNKEIKNRQIPESTRYSGYKRLLNNGFLIQENKSYLIEDPFFLRWLIKRREV